MPRASTGSHALAVALAMACAPAQEPSAARTDAAPGADAGKSAGTVILENVAADPLPVWVAWSDGDGPWRRLAGDGPIYTIRPTAERYGLAARCDRGSSPIEVTHALVAELPRVRINCARLAELPYKLRGDVLGVPGTQQLIMAIAVGGMSWVQRFDTTFYELPSAAGTFQLSAVALDSGEQVLAALLRRNVTITGDTVVNLDLRSEALPLARWPLEIEGAGAAPTVEAWLGNPQGGFVILPGSPRQYVTVAPAGLMAGDRQSLMIFDPAAGERRTVYLRVGATPPVRATLPASLTGVTVQRVARSGHDLFRCAFDAQAGAHQYAFSAGYLRSSMTPGWLGAGHEYTQPDLTGVPGWQPGWSIPPGSAIEAQVTATSSNRSLAETWDGTLTLDDDGFIRTSASRDVILNRL